MVDQIPNLGRESEMLSEIGLSSMSELFSNIPEGVRRENPLPLPPPQSEEQILEDARRLLGANVDLDSRPSFLSAGLARNFVPSMVPMLATRGEFLTSYTPYQPEVSQGMLQAMWEFQTMVSELVGLPISQCVDVRCQYCSCRGHNMRSSCQVQEGDRSRFRIRLRTCPAP